MTEEISTTPPPKKRKNSKKKGSSFEGTICKHLDVALSPMKFRRSQSSGAILGGKNVRFAENFSEEMRVLFTGDVTPTNELDVHRDEGWKFKFTVECKFYQTCDNLDHLFNNTKIKGWFLQALSDSKKINREPILIFKFNHTDIFCATDIEASNILPSTITKKISLDFGPGEPKINIFLLKEALQDPEWWKVRT